jgi:hypothetical protein
MAKEASYVRMSRHAACTESTYNLELRSFDEIMTALHPPSFCYVPKRETETYIVLLAVVCYTAALHTRYSTLRKCF